jgi:glycosyltransferase involved in cell wall biosynthesis
MDQRSNTPRRILVVGMADSIHLARWFKQYSAENLEFVLVSSSPHRRVHPTIDKFIRGFGGFAPTIKMSWVSRYLSLPMWLADKFLGDFLRGFLIARQIRSFNPDLVHALELQNAGYATAMAYGLLGSRSKPKLLITNYGSEIIWFKQFPSHLKKLKNLMQIADAFSAECSRDVQLAKEIGFVGEVMPTIPVSGGIDKNQLAPKSHLSELHARKSIVIKGYQNVWGQALVALRAIESMAPSLNGYIVELFSCNRETVVAAKKLKAKSSLDIRIHKKHQLTHAEVLGLMRRSRVYIGLSRSDGISTSMIEAMSQGAIPIQSNTSCGNEWIRSGQDGYLVAHDDWQAVAGNLLHVLEDDDFTLAAQARNLDTISEKYDSAQLSKTAVGYYEKLLG